ncbi:MAG: hypothetical protein IJM71_09005 [Clostridia bacterium]|nr:hypothetical protein [Clostridia bacterium]
MRLPELAPLKARREIINKFEGYNHRDVVLDGNNKYARGEWYDCNNLTSDKYPTAAVRGKRGEFPAGHIEAHDLFSANGAMGYVTHNAVCIRTGDLYTCFTLSQYLAEERRVVTMGAYVIVFPDMFYVNSADLTDHGYFGGTFRAVSGESGGEIVRGNEITIVTCLEDGTVIHPAYGSPQPQNPDDGDYWYSSALDAVQRYYDDSEEWVTVKTYRKIILDDHYFGNDMLSALKSNETVQMKLTVVTGGGAWFQFGANTDIDKPIKVIEQGTETDNNTTKTYFIVDASPAQATPHTWEFVISYGVPDMDYVIECQNRLWGCKYGYVDGEKINEIYASALGSFKEWHVYEGTSMDSYTASIGTDGPFTGAIKYNGNPIFFKERYMHRVYGSYPAQYQINTVECTGAEDGSWKSVAVNNGVAFWHSPFGIMAYDGASPVKISEAFGSVKYKNAAGGVHDGKYYVSLQDDGDEWYLFTYDISRRFWLKENGVHVRAFCTAGDELYMAEPSGIKTLNGSGTLDPYPVNWYAETGDLGLNSPDRKYVSRLTLRLKLAVGTWVKIWLKYDDVEWEWVGTCAGHKLDTFSLPVSVKRCDHFRLKLEGCGDAQIYSITRTVEGGSDL